MLHKNTLYLVDWCCSTANVVKAQKLFDKNLELVF